jgi:hypothetical protein
MIRFGWSLRLLVGRAELGASQSVELAKEFSSVSGVVVADWIGFSDYQGI